MNTLIKPGLFLSFILMMVSASANASGGIALGATRVIYPADAKQTSLAITKSRPAKTPCALSTQARRCLPIANHSFT